MTRSRILTDGERLLGRMDAIASGIYAKIDSFILEIKAAA